MSKNAVRLFYKKWYKEEILHSASSVLKNDTEQSKEQS